MDLLLQNWADGARRMCFFTNGTKTIGRQGLPQPPWAFFQSLICWGTGDELENLRKTPEDPLYGPRSRVGRIFLLHTEHKTHKSRKNAVVMFGPNFLQLFTNNGTLKLHKPSN